MQENEEPILNRDQKLAIDFIKQGKNVVITGQAGTGKSLVINQVVKWLKEVYGAPIGLNNTHSFYAITSMTGISSINLNGQTLHSWGGIGLGEGDVWRLVRLIDKRMKTPSWRLIKVLVIDEVSMMSMELFEKLHQIGCRIRGDSSKLFGGIQLVLCGDFMQLPPIGEGDAGRFCFESNLWKRHIKHTIYLTRIYRQQNQRFQEMLSRIRMGIVTAEDKTLLSGRLVKKVPKMEIKPTKLYPFKRNVKEINDREYDKLVNPKLNGGRRVVEHHSLPLYLMELKNGGMGDGARRSFGRGRLAGGRRMSLGEIRELQDELRRCSGREVCEKLGKGPENQSVRICVGAQVMINYNIDVSAGLANGVKGVVRRFDPDGNPFLKIDGIEEEVLIMRANHFWDTDRFKITIMQYPLQLAWASTIHKCVSGNSLIATYNGLMKIKDISNNYGVESDNFKSIEFDLHGESGQVKADQIYHGNIVDCVRITTERGFSIITSMEHPLRTINPNAELNWVKGSNLTVGTPLILRSGAKSSGKVNLLTKFIRKNFHHSKNMYALPEYMSENFAEMIGMIIGDGCISDTRGGRVDLTSGDPEMIIAFKDFTTNIFGLNVTVKKDINKESAYFHSRGVRKFLFHIGLDYVTARQKSIPWSILQSSWKCQARCLRGLFDTDGGVNGSGIHFTTSSDRLAKEVQILLLNLGIVSSRHSLGPDAWRIIICSYNDARLFNKLINFRIIRKSNALDKRFPEKTKFGIEKANRGGIPGGKILLQQALEELKQIYGKPYGQIVRLHLPITGLAKRLGGLSRSDHNITDRHFKTLAQLANEKTSDHLKFPAFNRIVDWNRNGWFIDKIDKIEKCQEEVYDLHIPEDHSYIGNGFINHNSQSQSLSKVVTDLSCVFSRGQSYVCLSRVRSLEGLYLKAIDFKKIQCNQVAKEYYQSLGYWCEYQLVDDCRDWVCNSAYSGHNMEHPDICDLCLIMYLTEHVEIGIPYEIWEIIVGYMNC